MGTVVAVGTGTEMARVARRPACPHQARPHNPPNQTRRTNLRETANRRRLLLARVAAGKNSPSVSSVRLQADLLTSSIAATADTVDRAARVRGAHGVDATARSAAPASREDALSALTIDATPRD